MHHHDEIKQKSEINFPKVLIANLTTLPSSSLNRKLLFGIQILRVRPRLSRPTTCQRTTHKRVSDGNVF